MQFFVDHWLEIAVVANTALLVFIAAEGRGIPERLAYLGRRIDKLDRALRDGRLTRAQDARPEPLRLISDRTGGPLPALTDDTRRVASR